MALIQLTSNMTSSELRETQNSNNIGFNTAITSLQTSVAEKSDMLIRSVSGVTATAYDAVAEKPAQLILSGNTLQPTLPNQYSEKAPIVNVTSPVSLNVTGKNMIAYPYYESGKTVNNVTYTINADSTIAVSTTAAGASATTTLSLNNQATPPVFPAGTYTISGCPAGGTIDTYFLAVQKKVGTTYTAITRDFGTGSAFTLTEPTALNIYAAVKINTIITTPIIFYPMLRLSSDTSTAYTAYSGTAYSVALTDNQASPQTHELCRLTDGTNVWADYIEKQSGVWKLIKCVGKVVLTGSETVTLPETPAASGYFRFNVALDVVPTSSQLNATSGSKCTHFVQGDSIMTPSFKFTTIGASSCIATFCVKDTTLTANTVGGVTVWLQHQNVDLSAPVTVYYPLATPVTYTLAAATQTVLNGIYAKTGTTNIWHSGYPGTSNIKAALYVNNDQSLAYREQLACKLNALAVADYVIERGTTGIWNYEKWASGWAKLIGTYSISTTITNLLGNIYASDLISSISYPFAFESTPQIFKSCRQDLAWCVFNGVGSVSATPTIRLHRCVSATDAETFYIDFEVFGKWQ